MLTVLEKHQTLSCKISLALNCILLLELPSTTVILVLILEVKATLKNGIYYYKILALMKLSIWKHYSVFLEEYRIEMSGLLFLRVIMWTFRWTKAWAILFLFQGKIMDLFCLNLGFHHDMSRTTPKPPFPQSLQQYTHYYSNQLCKIQYKLVPQPVIP